MVDSERSRPVGVISTLDVAKAVSGTPVSPRPVSSGRIVVGVDGSQGARSARWALAEARLRGDTVEVVHAWHAPPHMIPGPYAGPAAAGEEATDRMREQAERLLEHRGRAWTPTASRSNRSRRWAPRRTRSSTSRRAPSCSWSAPAAEAFTRLLGSVNQQVSHHAPCPVVVVLTRRRGGPPPIGSSGHTDGGAAAFCHGEGVWTRRRR